jgi:Glycosyltransferase family 87
VSAAAVAGAPRRRGLMLLLLAAVATASLLQGSVLRGDLPLDFTARYAAGQLVGHGTSPYTADAELVAAQRALMPLAEELPFYDPPPTAALFRLLSGLPVWLSALLWEVVSVACLALIGCLLADLVGVRGWPARLGIVSLLALFDPVRHSMLLGQLEAAYLVPLFAAMWLCLRRRDSALVVASSSALALLALCKPQLAYLPVAVILVRCLARRPLAALAGAAAAGAALVLLPWLLAPSARWGDWLATVRQQPDGASWPTRLLLLALGLAAVPLALRALRSCRGSLEGWLLLAAGCNGLAAAVVRWNPQWHTVLALPVLALLAAFAGGGAGGWSRRDRTVLALAVAACLPDALTTLTYYTNPLHAGIPLALSALTLTAVTVLGLVPAPWALLTWVLTAAVTVPPVGPRPGQAKGLLLCLAVLWLLPRVTAAGPSPDQEASPEPLAYPAGG